MRFHEKLAALMRATAASQAAIAAASGVKQPSVSRWLAGSTPRGKAARALAAYFKIPVECLLGDEFDLPEGSINPTYDGYQISRPVTEAMHVAERQAKSDRQFRLKVFRRVDRLEAELKSLRADLEKSL